VGPDKELGWPEENFTEEAAEARQPFKGRFL
jgi:hypothetical protein